MRYAWTKQAAIYKNISLNTTISLPHDCVYNYVCNISYYYWLYLKIFIVMLNKILSSEAIY